MNKEEVVKGKNLFDEKKIIDTGMKGILFVSIPFDEYKKLQKENEVLKEVHKEFATLCRELKIYDTLMSAKSVMEKVVSKEKIRTKIKKLEGETQQLVDKYGNMIENKTIRTLKELLGE